MAEPYRSLVPPLLVQSEKPADLRRKERVRGVALGGILVLALGLVLLVVHLVLDRELRHDDYEERVEALHQMRDELRHLFSDVHTDLDYLATTDLTLEALRASEARARRPLVSLMCRMIRLKRYDQVRLLDRRGHEVVRVNRLPEHTCDIVDAGRLQDKSRRYYFRATLELEPEQVYVSPLDLNIERGGIEAPRKPMIRFARAVFDEHGKRAGAAVINYLGAGVTEHLEALPRQVGSRVYLLNARGYYLHGPDPTREWTFMRPETAGVGFFSEYPDAWSVISRSSGDSWIAQQRFHVLRVSPAVQSTGVLQPVDAPWTIVLQAPPGMSYGRRLLLEGILITASFLVPLLAWVGWFLGRSLERNAWHMEELKRTATKDPLTGLDNRRSAYERLNGLFANAIRHGRALTIAYVDVNDLKQVNDRLGHEHGDQMIVAAGRVLQQNTRAGDVVARIGGDEFLVLFPDCRKDQANTAMERASEAFERLGPTGAVAYSFSWGCVERASTHQTLDDLVKEADLLMLACKRGRRSRPVILSA